VLTITKSEVNAITLEQYETFNKWCKKLKKVMKNDDKTIKIDDIEFKEINGDMYVAVPQGF
jgi:putative component of toxin-antitoxin plasmid stabilization module